LEGLWIAQDHSLRKEGYVCANDPAAEYFKP
jgi:hypothetical protein